MGTCAGKSLEYGSGGGAGAADAPQIQPVRRRLTVSAGDGADPGGGSSAAASSEAGSVLELFRGGQEKIAICGQACDAQQRSFADKLFATQRGGSGGGGGEEGLLLGGGGGDPRVGWCCKKGLKPDSPNQDDFCILRADGTSVYGVFDGHGPCGHDVSNYVQEQLPRAFAEHPRFGEEPLAALSAAFTRTHTLCIEQQLEGRLDCTLSGTTATLVVHRGGGASPGGVLHVAHVGDSRAVVGRARADGGLGAEDLTEDHKPSAEVERGRIVAAGGEVRRLEGDIPYRVFLRGKMYPGLAMTRAIGDTVGTVAGVTSTPTVRSFDVQDDWRFLLVCSDGVWEFIDSREAVELVGATAAADPQKAADRLASEAWARWIEEEGNVVDDITVICAWFPSRPGAGAGVGG